MVNSGAVGQPVMSGTGLAVLLFFPFALGTGGGAMLAAARLGSGSLGGEGDRLLRVRLGGVTGAGGSSAFSATAASAIFLRMRLFFTVLSTGAVGSEGTLVATGGADPEELGASGSAGAGATGSDPSSRFRFRVARSNSSCSFFVFAMVGKNLGHYTSKMPIN